MPLLAVLLFLRRKKIASLWEKSRWLVFWLNMAPLRGLLAPNLPASIMLSLRFIIGSQKKTPFVIVWWQNSTPFTMTCCTWRPISRFSSADSIIFSWEPKTWWTQWLMEKLAFWTKLTVCLWANNLTLFMKKCASIWSLQSFRTSSSLSLSQYCPFFLHFCFTWRFLEKLMLLEKVFRSITEKVYKAKKRSNLRPLNS